MAFKSEKTDGTVRPRRTSQRKRAETMHKRLIKAPYQATDGKLSIDRTSNNEPIEGKFNNQNNSEPDHSIATSCNVCAEHFQCGMCLKGFQTIKSLSSHKCKLSMLENFQCNICDNVFPTSHALSLHLDEHNDGVKPFKCGMCNAGFIENSRLLDHVTNSHKELPSFYKCRICLFSCEEVSKLSLHIEEKHLSKFRCGICGIRFGREKELSLHMQTHTEGSSKLSKCPICFSKVPASIMGNHIMTHNREKDKIILPRNRTHGFNKIRQKKRMSRPQNTSIQKRGKSGYVKITGNFQNETKNINNDSDKMESGSEENDTEDGVEEQVKRGRKGAIAKGPISNPTKVKPAPAIKDTKQLIASMKVDSENGNVVYDCDVCGIRVNNRDIFIQHRGDHFCDGKFCINCQHCSGSFDSFQELDGHIGPGKCLGYKCKTCGKSFSLEPILLTHQIKQHSSLTKHGGVFTCAVCEKTFDNKTAYVRHASSHSEDKCIQCKLCRHAFTTQESLLGHLRTTHSIIPLTRKQYKYNCEVCGANFMKDEALSTHRATVHDIKNGISASILKSEVKIQKSKLPETKEKNEKGTGEIPVRRTGHWRSAEDDVKRRTCPICNRVFGRFKDVRRHIGTHTKPYLCSHCGKSFPYRYSLDAHIKAYHSSENPHKCEICNKFFSCERSLMIHRRIHTGEKPHQCHICHKRFRQVANLSMHIKLHSTDKPIKCELCDYRCSHQGYLKRHMSTHSTEKKHMCPICNKGFTEKPNLNHHLKRHSKIKNHVCAVCGHRFAERYYLNNHMRIHTKEKPYTCPVCNRAFTMRPNMVSHIKKTHPSYNYQPVRPSHKQVSDSNPDNITNTETHTRDVSVTSTNIVDSRCNSSTDTETSSTIAAITIMPSNTFASVTVNSKSMSTAILPAASHPLTTIASQLPLPPLSSTPQLQIQLQQTAQPPSNVSISTGRADLVYQQLTNPPTIVKLDTLRFLQAPPSLGPRNLLANCSHHQLQQQTELQQQQQQLQPMGLIPEANIQQNENVQRGPNDIVEQTIQQNPERVQHQYNVNISDRFISSHFADSQQIHPVAVTMCQHQNFTAAPIASQSYMYTYPSSTPSSDNLLPMPVQVQGFFTNHQVHQNSKPLPSEQEGPLK